MPISYSNKVNERAPNPPASISNEMHTIGILGVATAMPGYIRLVEVPQGPAPAVTIPGYNEITSGTPTGMQFLVDYDTGVIEFDVAQDGNSIMASYMGLGSEIAAEDINELQEPVGIALNIDGSLSSGIVTTSSLSGSLVLPRINIQPLNTSIVPVTDGSGFLVSSTTTTTQLSYLDATSSIQTQLNSKQNTLTIGDLTDVGTDGIVITGGTGSIIGSGVTVSQHVADATHNGYLSSADWNTFNSDTAGITALTSDVSATGPGSAVATVNSVGGSSAANIHSAELAANAATDADTSSTIVKRDGSGNFSAGTVIASLTGHASLDLALTGGTMSGAIDMGTFAITDMADPTNPQDAATKNYVDTHETAPAGSDTQIQYNSSGSFAGASGVTTNGTNLSVSGNISTQVIEGTGSGTLGLVFTDTSGNINGHRLLALNTTTKEALFYGDVNTTNVITTDIATAGIHNVDGSSSPLQLFPGTSNNAVKVTTALNSTVIAYFDAINIRLGVNTSSPAYTLDVNGAGNFNGNQIHTVADPTSAQDVATKAYVDNLFPVRVTNVALTDQNTDLGPTTLFTPTSTGVYRVSVYLTDTVTGTATITATIGWTDDGQSETASTAALPLTLLGYTSSTFVIEDTVSNPITYSVTHTGGYTTDMYSIYITVERLS